MRIAHVVRSLDPLGGGPPIVVVRLAAELARQGHEVRVISHAAPEAQTRIAEMIGALPGADQVQYETVGSSVSPGELSHDLEIVHLHGVWDSIIRSTAAAALGRGIPYIVAPHGMLDPWSLAQKKWKKKLALALGYRAMLNKAAFLHLLNRDEKDLIAPLKLKSETRVIPNGIAPEEFSVLPPAGTFRTKHPEIGAAPFILFLSRLHYKKGLDILADAFALLVKGPQSRDVHLVVAGPDDGARMDFERQTRDAGLENQVHLVGPLFGLDKLAALVDADCFCLPSRQEGFSVAILEAMACGLAVVISSECHFPEVAEQKAGEIVELNAAAIAAALARVLSNPRPMGDAGRRMVLQKFTWPKVVEMLIEHYHAVSGRPG